MKDDTTKKQQAAPVSKLDLLRARQAMMRRKSSQTLQTIRQSLMLIEDDEEEDVSSVQVSYPTHEEPQTILHTSNINNNITLLPEPLKTTNTTTKSFCSDTHSNNPTTTTANSTTIPEEIEVVVVADKSTDDTAVHQRQEEISFSDGQQLLLQAENEHLYKEVSNLQQQQRLQGRASQILLILLLTLFVVVQRIVGGSWMSNSNINGTKEVISTLSTAEKVSNSTMVLFGIHPEESFIEDETNEASLRPPNLLDNNLASGKGKNLFLKISTSGSQKDDIAGSNTRSSNSTTTSKSNFFSFSVNEEENLPNDDEFSNESIITMKHDQKSYGNFYAMPMNNIMADTPKVHYNEKVVDSLLSPEKKKKKKAPPVILPNEERIYQNNFMGAW
eukprot:CAMPEP_0178907124 /NCGR_PEP_ID=MMETSP0786-20121207/7198_1 /TAXON_ID=186022 /ORGANISM="Thalassionema frauenfeldii, Strain CCMP 1798" /LENGTH=387 /DNA_ID=CAMNT_0020578891 /DNA_START=30 /DNA_END=1190 /DNA_ORIENTATION=+